MVTAGVSFANVSNAIRVDTGELLSTTKALRALTKPKMNEDVIDIHKMTNANMYGPCAFFLRSFPGIASVNLLVKYFVNR